MRESVWKSCAEAAGLRLPSSSAAACPSHIASGGAEGEAGRARPPQPRGLLRLVSTILTVQWIQTHQTCSQSQKWAGPARQL